MISRQLVHAKEDVALVLKRSQDLGLTIQIDDPSNLPEPKIVSMHEFSIYGKGGFILYKPEWLHGERIFTKITAGYNRGKFFQNPATNLSQINLIMNGELSDNGNHRLGSGLIGYPKDWISSENGQIYQQPKDVKSTYIELVKMIGTGFILKGGGHRYIVLENAERKLRSGVAVPPFDFIA